MKPLAFACCALFCAAEVLRGEEMTLLGHGKVSVSTPVGWVLKHTRLSLPDQGEYGYMLEVTAPGGRKGRGVLTFLYVKGQPPSEEAMADMTRQIGQQFLPDALEKAVTPRPFALKRGYGFYSLFTSAKAAEAWKITGSGAVQLSSDLLVAVTLLADDPEGREFNALVDMVNSLAVKQGP